MKNIDLWERGQIPFYDEALHVGVNEDSCTLTPYLIEDGKEHGCVLIFPGGGYVHRSEKEAAPVAEYINSLGMHAFLVNYRVIPYDPHLGVVDGKRAMQFVRSKMSEFKIKEGCLGVMGFSAGAGNASLTTLTYDVPEYEVKDELDKTSPKPDFAIFCYGAMSVDPKYFTEADLKNFEDIIPEEEREEYINANSPDRKVRDDMPPTFIWHCVDDARVNVGCCLSFINAMQEHGVDYECHLFPEGGHGKSIREAAQIPGVCKWPELLADWLRRKNYSRKMEDTVKYCTLCYIERDDQYLMLYRNKKEKDPNEGKWIGVGGKLETGETPDNCVLREVLEETGLILTDYTYHGIVHFRSDKWADEEMYLYTAKGFEGDVNFDCPEGALKWIPKSEVMDLSLWEGDRIFLKYLLEGKKDIDLTLVYKGGDLVEVRDN